MKRILIIILILILLILGYFGIFKGINVLGIEILSVFDIKRRK